MPILSEESRIFFRKFVQDPKQVGSVAPSSRFLAEAMTRPIPWEKAVSVAELGAGTGAITREIAKRARPSTNVYLFEKDAKMRRRLAEAYPQYGCFANAENVLDVLERAGLEPLDGIVSGLPFYNFSESLRSRLIGQIEGALKPDGLFVAFQYSLQMKKRLAAAFEIERIGFVALNLPPAFVYVCRKRRD
ncbi:class I SAM-dependent methyltransferase [Cohnella zeiphila]|uniref:Methyltransferase domain-containing protein n=1 Tax=Cohnella zeiphila TaxID=2761120 RepID=A0A7X0VUR9_9BACL|nr:methyltransferase domain-containing protein [Cohnella zeiphila]MBB6730582.1 methyltransferase domain-containing protein [Cohnella zeiphila]